MSRLQFPLKPHQVELACRSCGQVWSWSEWRRFRRSRRGLAECPDCACALDFLWDVDPSCLPLPASPEAIAALPRWEREALQRLQAAQASERIGEPSADPGRSAQPSQSAGPEGVSCPEAPGS